MLFQTKNWNCLNVDRLNRMVFVNNNKKLNERFMTNKMLEKEDPTKYDPIRAEELNYTSEVVSR